MNANPDAAAEPPLRRRWLFGAAMVDESRGELLVDGEPVALERKFYRVLLHLLQHAGEVVTKDELLEAVWPGRVVGDDVLNRCISGLRKALGDDARQIIRTLHGLGYRFDAALRVEQLETPDAPLSLTAGDQPPLRPHWRLLRRLGYGGHGEAWLGEHLKTGERRVFKFALDARALGSLKREITLFRVLREGLGERDDVVEVLDWNLDEPPCYVECEFVAAGDLRQWAADRGGMAALPPALRLDILARIADGVAAAHSVGVLHKDLKPGNVLVHGEDTAPRIKLTDFGSGGVVDPERLKALGITRLGFTRAGATADSSSGTPLYLAPEVLIGQPATVKADIYGLGVMLYQLAIGDLERPLAPGWESDIDDPLLREDIAIAVHGDPAGRLDSAAELAERLRTLPERHAERARRQDAERAQARLRAMRARRGWLLALLATLLAGTALSTWLYLGADRARTEAEAVGRFVTRDMLAIANPNLGPTRAISLTEVLTRAAGMIDARLADQPEAAARLHQEVARSFHWLGETALSERHYDRAIALYTDTRGAQDLSTLLAAAELWLAQHNSLWLGAYSGPDSEASADALRRGIRRQLPADHPFVIYMDLVAEFQRWRRPGQYAQVGRKLQDLLTRARQARPLEPGAGGRFVLLGDKPREIVGLVALGLSDYHALGGRFAEALAAIELALEVHEEIQPEGSYQLANMLNRKGYLLFQLGRFEASAAIAERAREAYARWVDDDAGEYAFLRAGTGFLALEQGQLDRAEAIFDSVIALCAGNDCPPMIRLARAMCFEGLAGVRLEQGRPAAAVTAAERSVSAIESLAPYSAEAVEYRVILAEALLASGAAGPARDALDGINTLSRAYLIADSPLLAEYRRVEGLLAQAAGRRAEAERALRDALRIETLRRDTGHWKISRLARELSRLGAVPH